MSNSKETSLIEYKREKDLLKSSLTSSNRLLYFSTCSVTDPNLKNSLYVSHKLSLEKLVLSSKNNIVIRLPQVVGVSKNPFTLTNFLAYKIYKEEAYDLFKGTIRNIIDIEDVVTLTKYIFNKKLSDNLYSFNMPIDFEVSQIVSCLEIIIGKRSMHISKKGHPFKYLSSSFISNAILDKVIHCDSSYLEKTLFRVYSNYPDGFK